MIRNAVAHAAVALAIVACGCARHEEPVVLADATTRGVYDADYARTTERFDDALKAEVTRASIGRLSGQMRALGAYRGLKQISSDPGKGRYDFQADFEKGTMLVALRIDPDQKIGAYRVVPQGAAQASPTPTR